MRQITHTWVDAPPLEVLVSSLRHWRDVTDVRCAEFKGRPAETSRKPQPPRKGDAKGDAEVHRIERLK